VYPADLPLGRPAPLAVIVHGGGWTNGSRDDMVQFVPHFTSRRYVVVNVGYRVASEAPAPAAAEDVRNAIECVRRRAAEWGAAGGILLAGFSAGAHLALLSALAPSTVIAGPRSSPRAIVSFWGITDVADLLDGDHARDFARRWLPAQPGRPELARRLSPINYGAAEAPALCAVHSVHDDVVPFAHSERLVMKWQAAKRPAKLIRLSHQGHAAPSGDYPAIFREIFRFLEQTGGVC
jgi:acetyl esterase/lipase